jgi:phage gp29-like protein
MSNDKIIAADVLTGEILSSERLGNYMAFAYNLGLTALPDDPSWAWIQLKTNPWLAMAIYEDLEEKDDKISSDLDTRKESVLAKSRTVLPASEKRQDRKLADFIGETLEGYMGGGDGLRFGFDSFLWEALDAIGKGVAIGENIYESANDRLYIKSVNFKPQFLFSFGEGALANYSTYALPQTGPLRLRPDVFLGGVGSGEPLPEQKFFVHTFRSYQGNRWGTPLLRRVFWLSWFKRAGVKQWLRYLERGPGTVLARYSDGASADEKKKALEAAQALAEEMAAAIPKKFEAEVLENTRHAMGSSHSELVDDYCNNGIARVILGQTLTSRGSEGGGSRALGEVHERVAGRKTETDAKSLMLAVNTRLVWPLTILNYGVVERPPIWTIQYEPGADMKMMSEVLYKLWQMNVPLAVKPFYQTFQIKEPTEGEEVLALPKSNNGAEQVDTEEEDTSFAEKGDDVKKKSGNRRSKPLSSSRERFGKLRPSMMRYSRE